MQFAAGFMDRADERGGRKIIHRIQQRGEIDAIDHGRANVFAGEIFN